MRSGWFWGTEAWELYQKEYYRDRERPDEYKTSPLANDHDFGNWGEVGYETEIHITQVIDLQDHRWGSLRQSYHSIIHRADEQFEYLDEEAGFPFMWLHRKVFGHVRNDATFRIQAGWLVDGNAMSLTARRRDAEYVACAFWIIYQQAAYYASGPSLQRNVMHAVIWHSFDLLRKRGVRFVEMGQIDGVTEKEKNIGRFKAGFGGTAMPYQVIRKGAR